MVFLEYNFMLNVMIHFVQAVSVQWTGLGHNHLFCFILQSKHATGLKLCILIENMLLYKIGTFLQTSVACVVATELKLATASIYYRLLYLAEAYNEK